MSSLVTFPLSFPALGCATVGAPLESITRTIERLQPDEVLVRVSYASINPMDAKVHATNMLQLPLPMVLGYSFSGILLALGTADATNDVEALTLGSAVMGSTAGFRWGGGCFGQYVVAKRSRTVLRGSELPEPEAATYSPAYLSAYEPLMLQLDIRDRAGQTIFIPGGAGGVGHFAVQLAKAYGLRVIASASKPNGLRLLHSLGADVVNYSKQEVVSKVLEATNSRGVEMVYDATYAESSLLQSAAVVREKGHWMRLGPWNHGRPGLDQQVGAMVSARLGQILIADLARYDIDPEYRAKLPQLMDGLRVARQLFVEGRVRPYISATVPLSDVAAVQQAVLDSATGTVGKVVVKVQ